MAQSLRLATYNVEWFNALFDDKGRLLEDSTPSARYQVSRGQQLGALGIVFTALDADAVMIVEAPDQSRQRSCVAALEAFAKAYGLRCCKAIIGFKSDTEQEIAFLYDPLVLEVLHEPQESAFVPRFDRAFRTDLDLDGLHEEVRFSKPPLELRLRLRGAPGGREIQVIGVHVKSKGAHREMTPAEFRRLSIQNRRRQLAECHWLRLRVEDHLRAGRDVVVMGDFNDGPGLDEFEKLFGHSGVEVVLGLETEPGLRLYDPNADQALSQRLGLMPTTARFWIAPQKRYFEALLDYIMVSPGLAALAQPGAWRVWHPFNDPAIVAVPDLATALLQASDHFPVTLTLTL